jgi:hypothetical protein
MARSDGRNPKQLRPVTLTRNWLKHAEGSVLVEFGDTRVLCAASAQEGAPPFRARRRGRPPAYPQQPRAPDPRAPPPPRGAPPAPPPPTHAQPAWISPPVGASVSPV